MSASSSDKRYPCDQVVPIEREPRHHLVIENEFVRGFAVEVAAHDRTLCHHHPHDYLVYVATEAEIVSAARDQEPKRLSYVDGECELSSAGMTHVVENVGEKPFRNVVAELLPAAGALRRGADPQLIRGEAKIVPQFDDDRAAVFVVHLSSSAEVEVRGPALIATPYGSVLNPEDPGTITIKPNPISGLAWVPAEEQAVLWGTAPASARVVVFMIGLRSDEALAGVRELH
jgi:hypothetical protein